MQPHVVAFPFHQSPAPGSRASDTARADPARERHDAAPIKRLLNRSIVGWPPPALAPIDASGATTVGWSSPFQGLANSTPRGHMSLSENRPQKGGTGGQAHFAPKPPQNEPVPEGCRLGSIYMMPPPTSSVAPGRVNLKCDPVPGSDSTQMAPPCRSTVV